MLYGGFGLVYWLMLLFVGHSPADLLHMMPCVAAAALVLQFSAWLLAMRVARNPNLARPGQL